MDVPCQCCFLYRAKTKYGSEINVLAYADDTTIITNDYNSMEVHVLDELFKVDAKYSEAS